MKMFKWLKLRNNRQIKCVSEQTLGYGRDWFGRLYEVNQWNMEDGSTLYSKNYAFTETWKDRKRKKCPRVDFVINKELRAGDDQE